MEFRFNLVDMYALQNLCGGKEVILCGERAVASGCAKKLMLIGIRPSYLLNLPSAPGADIEHTGLPEISVKELKEKENPFYILLTERKGVNRQAEYLIEQGYIYLKDFACFDKAAFQGKLTAGNSLDPTTGHSSGAYDENGVIIRGNNHLGGLKLAVIGASLADETYFDWKFWTEFLYEKLVSSGRDIIQILGASYGYTTSQCLLKLIRDILPCEPDIVLDYCPVENDCYYGENLAAPYVTGYQKKMMSLLKGRLKDRFEEKMVKTFSWGNRSEKPTAQIVLENMKIKQAICGELGIRYLCVFPPSISTKKIISEQDMTLYWCWEKHAATARKVYAEIEKRIGADLLCNVIDARGWVDEEAGIFYDQFHMYEAGNEIIAEKLACILEDIDNKDHFGFKRHMQEDVKVADMDDYGNQQRDRL